MMSTGDRVARARMPARRAGSARVRVVAATLAIAIAELCAAAPIARPSAVEPVILNATDPGFVAPRALTQRNPQGTVAVLVELSGPAGLERYVAAGGRHGHVNASADAALSSQVNANRTQQDRVAGSIRGKGIAFTEIYRVQQVKNAIAMKVSAADVAKLRSVDGVLRVRVLQKEVPTSAKSVPFVGAPSVWEGGETRPAVDGTGIKIAIIDSGIDYMHANFGGDGSAASYADNDRISTVGHNSGVPIFPTTKVVGGTDLAGDDYDANDDAAPPQPDDNPMDCGGHGSHVAGTAAGYGVTTGGATFPGPFDTAIDADALRIYPGMAPNAKLYAYRIFGCGGSTFLTVDGIEHAVTDGVDVINMSLGSPLGGLSDTSAEAAEAAAAAGVIVVVSAGNGGDSYFNVGSPSSAKRVISVANSWDGYENAATVASPGGNYFAVPASFGPALPSGTPLSGEIAIASPANACSTVSASVSGKIAIVDRGTCNFIVKIVNAQVAGATAVVVVDNTAEVPIVMGGDATATISSVMISQPDGAALKAQAGATVSLPLVPGGDMVNASSSRGPNNGSADTGMADMIMKADITAPGTNIVSTQTGMTCNTGGDCITPAAGGVITGNQSLTISGTSMAAPHVAGMTALLRQLHPDYTVEEIKALAMNGAIHDLYTAPLGGGYQHSASLVGAGRIDSVAAADLNYVAFADGAAGAVNLTFPGQIGPGPTSVTKALRIENKGASPVTLTPGIAMLLENPGITFSVPSTPVTIPAGGSTTIDVTMDGDPATTLNNFNPTTFATQLTTLSATAFPRYWMGEASGYVVLEGDDESVARVPVFVAPFPAGEVKTDAAIQTGGAASGTATINIGGTPVCTGTPLGGDPASDCNVSSVEQALSLVLPYEMVAETERDPAIPAGAQVRTLGIGFEPLSSRLTFGIGMWAPVSMPGTPYNDVEITLVDGSGNPLYTIFPYIARNSSGSPTNVIATAVYRWATGTSSLSLFANGWNPAGNPDMRFFQNDVSVLGVSLSSLGITATSTITYWVDSWVNGELQQELGPFTYHLAAPGVSFGAGGDDSGWFLPGFSDYPISVAYNAANLAANGSLGALMIHLHNAPGNTQQKVLLAGTAPTFANGFSRKVHGAAGAFDLLLSANSSDPTTEPRRGPSQTVVFSFDKPVGEAHAALTEGSGDATLAATSFTGNDVEVQLTNVSDRKYVTVELSGIVGADGATGAPTVSRRVGFLMGDTNQNRKVTVADMGLINTVLGTTTVGNFLRDIDASGTISAADIGLANSNLAKVLPAP